VRGEREVRVCGRLGEAVLDMRSGIARAALNADERTTVVPAPADAVRRERVGPEARVGVRRRVAEDGHLARVVEEPRDELAPRLRDELAVVGEDVPAALGLEERHMKVPAVWKEVRKGRPAH